jgi:hypothetical protein
MDERSMVLADQARCPFATPDVPDTPRAAFYCRVPSGRVRIPAPEEQALFCRSGRFYACPVVRRYVNEH